MKKTRISKNSLPDKDFDRLASTVAEKLDVRQRHWLSILSLIAIGVVTGTTSNGISGGLGHLSHLYTYEMYVHPNETIALSVLASIYTILLIGFTAFAVGRVKEYRFARRHGAIQVAALKFVWGIIGAFAVIMEMMTSGTRQHLPISSTIIILAIPSVIALIGYLSASKILSTEAGKAVAPSIVLRKLASEFSKIDPKRKVDSKRMLNTRTA